MIYNVIPKNSTVGIDRETIDFVEFDPKLGPGNQSAPSHVFLYIGINVCNNDTCRDVDARRTLQAVQTTFPHCWSSRGVYNLLLLLPSSDEFDLIIQQLMLIFGMTRYNNMVRRRRRSYGGHIITFSTIKIDTCTIPTYILIYYYSVLPKCISNM